MAESQGAPEPGTWGQGHPLPPVDSLHLCPHHSPIENACDVWSTPSEGKTPSSLLSAEAAPPPGGLKTVPLEHTTLGSNSLLEPTVLFIKEGGLFGVHHLIIAHYIVRISHCRDVSC